EIQGYELYAGMIKGSSPSDADFTYDADYLLGGVPISVSLPLQSEAFSPTQTSCFFEGLLPEGFSRKSVARWMRADEADYLTILAGLGKECLGAIRIEDAVDHITDQPFYEELNIDQVKQLAAEGATKSTELLVRSHLSLTGATGKVGLYLHNGKWYQPLGTAPSTHIVKQSHVRLQHIIENERLALLTAERLGILTVRSFIINADAFRDSDILLATERYDRDRSNSVQKINGLDCPLRLHQEDFAQALGVPGSAKYEHFGDDYLRRIFQLVRNTSADPLRDQLRLLDILIYDKLIGNTDNHIKNLSFLYAPDLRSLRLAPAYDLVSTLIYRESAAEMSIAIAGELRWDKITKDTFLEASDEMGLSKKIIAREYDRLASLLPSAIRETAAHMEAEGFINAPEIAQKILEL
ncbi:MAG: HipA domain-containing protein, partial [Oscillospiraceae bacterium]|nr:HipA domain-containing protein [Oscillospiraceae bacterium]